MQDSKGLSTQSLALAGGVSSMLQAFSTAYATRQRAKANKYIAETNKAIEEIRARQALRRGRQKMAVSRQRTKKLIGRQRAVLAAQGIRVDAGTALAIQQEAMDMGELDAVTIENNAAMVAFGFISKAQSIGLQSELNVSAARVKSADVMMTGIIKGYGFYDQWKRSGQ